METLCQWNFIAAILPCLFLLLQGNIWIVILTGIVAGILAEVIAGIGKFLNPKLNVLSYVFFSENLLGGFLPIWVLLVMIAGTVIFSLIGCMVSKKLFRKHFEKVGMV